MCHRDTRRRRRGIRDKKNLSEKIITENFPNLVREKDIQVQESETLPIKMNPKRPTPRHITIKMTKLKERERERERERES